MKMLALIDTFSLRRKVMQWEYYQIKYIIGLKLMQILLLLRPAWATDFILKDC